MTHNKIQYAFFITVIVVVAVVLFFIFKPFLSALFLALSFAVVFRPLYEKIMKEVGGRSTLSAILTIFVVSTVVILPIVFISGLLLREVRDLYFVLLGDNSGSEFVANISTTLERYAHAVAPEVSINISEYLAQFLGFVVEHLDSLFSGFFKVIVSLFMMLIALFYFLRDGSVLYRNAHIVSPLNENQDEAILRKMGAAINSVVKGSLTIAIIQGVLTSVGFALFGVLNPVLWGMFAMFSSLIPGIGTSLVLIPGIIYLFGTGSAGAGIGLLLWSVIAVGLIDNIMSPILIKKGVNIHPFLILISVLGGLSFFGPIGFIAGPVILALFFALVDIYPSFIGPSGNRTSNTL